MAAQLGATLLPASLQDCAAGARALASEVPVTTLLHQPRRAVHCVARAAANLARATRKRWVRGNGRGGHDVGGGGARGQERCEARHNAWSSDGGGGVEARTDRGERCEGSRRRKGQRGGNGKVGELCGGCIPDGEGFARQHRTCNASEGLHCGGNWLVERCMMEETAMFGFGVV